MPRPDGRHPRSLRTKSMAGSGLPARFGVDKHSGRRIAKVIDRCDMHARKRADEKPVVPRYSGRRTGPEIREKEDVLSGLPTILSSVRPLLPHLPWRHAHNGTPSN